MRSYCSLYVDAGYLMAAASTRVTGTSLRSATEMNVAGLLEALAAQAEEHSGLPLLRIHWYDAGTKSGAPAGNQREIASLAKVKLRLGRIGFGGEQKGVDLKIALDLIAQSRNRVSEVVYLVSGDDDLSEAVEEAQHLGVQVISMVVPDEELKAISVSKHLQMTVDQMVVISPESIDANVKRSAAAAMRDIAQATEAETEAPEVKEPASDVPAIPTPLTVSRIAAQSPVTPVAPVPAARVQPRAVPLYSTTTGQSPAAAEGIGDDVLAAINDVVDKVVTNWKRSASPDARRELERGKPIIPQELDRTLLNDLSNRLSVWDIPTPWRFELREAFWQKLAG